MTSFSPPPKLSGRFLLLTAGIFLLAATNGALAKNGGNSGDRGEMRSHESSRDSGDHYTMKSHESNRDRDNGVTYAQKHKDKDGDRSSEKTKDKDKAPGATTASKTPPAPGTAGTNTIHPIVTSNPTSAKAGKPISVEENAKPQTVPGASPPPGTAGTNTIHPIINNNPTQPTAGKLLPNDPVGNTHPTPGATPPTVVTVSNGASTYQIQNGPGGVAVYSDKPGTITVTNGTESKTLPGASLTLSGSVIAVGAGQGIEVGARNGEGNTVVAIKPQSPPNFPSPIEDFGGSDPASTILKGVSDFGYGVTHGFAPGPAPPETTSTTSQY